MANKLTKSGSKLLAVIFTGIVAPLVVDVTTKILSDDEPPRVRRQPSSQGKEPPCRLPHPTSTLSTSRPDAPPPSVPTETTQVIAQGAGKTPEDALRGAVRAALAQALALEVDEAVWTNHGKALLEDALRNRAALIQGIRELRTSRRWKLTGTVYQHEIAMEIDRRVLRSRIRALGTSF